MVETVRETIERVMREQGNFNNPLTINTPIGSRTFYERDDSALVQKSQQVQTSQENDNEVIHNNYQMPKSDWSNVVMGAITGVGEGLVGGVERFVDGLTHGEYSKIVNSNFDNAYTNRQNKLQDRADSVGLGNANRLANMTISASGRAMPWVYGLGKIK